MKMQTPLHEFITDTLEDDAGKEKFNAVLATLTEDELNTYNDAGRTPLQEAIFYQKKYFAEQLARHPLVNIHDPCILPSHDGTEKTDDSEDVLDSERRGWNYYSEIVHVLNQYKANNGIANETIYFNLLASAAWELRYAVSGEIIPYIPEVEEHVLKTKKPKDPLHGTSSWRFAIQNNLNTVADILRDRGGRLEQDVDKFVYQYPMAKATDIEEEKAFLSYLAHSNLASLRTLIKLRGKSLFGFKTSVGENLLHIMVNARQFDAVKLLLNRTELNKLLEDELTAEEFGAFIYGREENNQQSFERTYDPQYTAADRKRMLLVFLSAQTFDPNQHTSQGTTLPHLLINSGDENFVFKCANNRTINFNLKNNQGNTPLREACEEKDEKTAVAKLRLLKTVEKLGHSIDMQDVGHKEPIRDHLQNFQDKKWFGKSTVIMGLTVENLIHVLRTQQSHTFSVSYSKKIVTLKAEGPEAHRAAVERAFTYYYNRKNMQCVVDPIMNDFPYLPVEMGYGKEPFVGSHFEIMLQFIAKLEDDNFWLTKGWGHFDFADGTVLELNDTGIVTQSVVEERVVTYDFLVKKLKDQGLDFNAQTSEHLLSNPYAHIVMWLASEGKASILNEVLDFKNMDFEDKIVTNFVNNEASLSRQIRRISANITQLYNEKKQKTQERKKKDRAKQQQMEDSVKRIGELERQVQVSQQTIVQINNNVQELRDQLISPAANKVSINSDIKKHTKLIGIHQNNIKTITGLIKQEQNTIDRLSSFSLPSTPVRVLADKIYAAGENSAVMQFTAIVAQKLAQVNFQQHSNSQIMTDYRRLDGLARLLEGDQVCAAVTFHEGQFILAFNYAKTDLQEPHGHLITNFLDHFSEIASGNMPKILPSKLLVNAIVLNPDFPSSDFESFIKSIVDKILSLPANKFPSLDTVKKDAYGNFTEEEIKVLCKVLKMNYPTNMPKNFKKTNELITRCFRLSYDYLKIKDSLKSKSNKKFDDGIFQAFKDKKLFIIKPELSGSVHAEMRILDYFYAQKINPANQYIGINKLCCAHCQLVLQQLNTSVDQMARGSHGDTYTWEPPECLKQNFTEIFGKDPEFILLYDEISRSDPQMAFNIIKYIDIFIYNKNFSFHYLLNFIKDNMRSTQAEASMSRPKVTTASIADSSNTNISVTTTTTTTTVEDVSVIRPFCYWWYLKGYNIPTAPVENNATKDYSGSLTF